MAIQWFPGHMNVTRKAIAERVKDIDVVLELLDARLPGSSANPMLAELTAGRPTLKILNKQDLADPVCTTAWLDHYNAQPGTRALALDASQTTHRQAIIDACHSLSPLRGGMAKPMRVLACGVPNVGKSTLINTLSAKRQAKTGDEAGITKLEQRIVLADDFYLWDTPGMLWPRITVPRAGYNLAISGAVGRNAYDDEEVALELLAYLKGHYAGLLAARFKVPKADALQDEELLEDIGRRRGALLGRGKVNVQKAAEIVIHEFRAATLGRITLETPEEFADWTAQAQAAEAVRLARREARKNKPAKPAGPPRDPA
jgi:ribosome biogenesis GTPase A